MNNHQNMLMNAPHLFLSCEHGNNHIPNIYNHLFEGLSDILASHRGYDKGALKLFRQIEETLHPEFAIYSETCRLIVDLNRSLHKRSLFSEWTKKLSTSEKATILDNHYFPFRQLFAKKLAISIENKRPVLHLSIHSFTPVLNGVTRQTDIGILYNPERPTEKSYAMHWKKILQKHLPKMRIRFNYPYLGKPDGHVAFHRKNYADNEYAGIEFELNQKHADNPMVYKAIVLSAQELLALKF